MAVTVVAVSVAFSILAGYAFASMRFPFKGTLFVVLLAGLMLPYEALIIPLYFGFRDLGLIDSRWAVILPQNEAAQTAPLALSFFAGLRRGGDPGTIAAAALIVAVPVLIMYILMQRRFIQGITTGATKG